jgi:hypothetical protein
MHANIDDLLRLRDAQPVDSAIAAHAARCPACAAQLERLSLRRTQLQTLPQWEAPAASWEQIQARLSRPRRARGLPGRFVAAAALTGLAIIGSIAVRDQVAAPVAQRATAMAGVRSEVDAEQLAILVAQSQQLEQLLRTLPARPRIERVSTAAAVDGIEQRIQWLDFQMSNAPEEALDDEQARRMWRERVDLMDALVKVRYVEAERFAF